MCYVDIDHIAMTLGKFCSRYLGHLRALMNLTLDDNVLARESQ